MNKQDTDWAFTGNSGKPFQWIPKSFLKEMEKRSGPN